MYIASFFVFVFLFFFFKQKTAYEMRISDSSSDVCSSDLNFNQPGATSIAINRVLGDSASNIFGNLNSNGNIFLINTNGVLFGANAQVNVGGLVASALDIESADFDNGVFVFANAGGDVVNQGRIVAGRGGTVALLGNEAVNAAGGSIVAAGGSVN